MDYENDTYFDICDDSPEAYYDDLEERGRNEAFEDYVAEQELDFDEYFDDENIPYGE